MMIRRADDSGAVAVFVAVASMLFLLVAALVVDLGMAMENRRDAQKAVDLAALAGGQDLPDKVAARAVVADYLLANGWGTDPSGNDLDSATLIANLTTPSLDDGYVDFTNSALGATQMLVTAPERDVEFVFAPVGALVGGGVSGTQISAQATVQIRSLKDILPFILTSDTEFGENCIKTGSGRRAITCPDSTEGNFGYALVGRNDSETPILRANIRYGLDHNPARYTTEPYVSQGWSGTTIQCKTSPTVTPINSITDKRVGGVYGDGFNCLDSRTGMTIADLTRGLLHYTGPSSCDGRIALPTPTCQFSPDLSASYFSGVDWDAIDPDFELPSAVLDDPRFGVVPVVAAVAIEEGSSFAYIILDFYGVYLTDVFKKDGIEIVPMASPTDGNAAALAAMVFPLSMAPSVAANDEETGDYLGSGPKIPVLID